jgi:DNA-binding GntR family transcriptional regulator
MPQPQRLTLVSLREQAAQVIRARIAAGDLRPGVLYPIGRISAELGVSATPVREALLDLAHEGLVDVVRNRGFRVQVLSETDLQEIVELRLLLEVPVLDSVAQHLTPEHLADLVYLADEVEAAAADGDLVRYLSLDRDLHLQLIGIAGNSRLLATVASLRDQTRLYGLARLVGTSSLMSSTQEHREILSALARGDVTAAKNAMRHHIRHVLGLWAGRSEDE